MMSEQGEEVVHQKPLMPPKTTSKASTALIALYWVSTCVHLEASISLVVYYLVVACLSQCEA